jgi:hypothetical protein
VTAVIDTYLPVGVEDHLAPAPRVQVEATGGDVIAIETAELAWRDQVELEATTRARRENIRTIIEARFGRVSSALEAPLEGVQSEETLDALLRRAAVALTEDAVLEQLPWLCRPHPSRCRARVTDRLLALQVVHRSFLLVRLHLPLEDVFLSRRQRQQPVDEPQQREHALPAVAPLVQPPRQRQLDLPPPYRRPPRCPLPTSACTLARSSFSRSWTRRGRAPSVFLKWLF